ncbi:MAG: hypothetical protein ACI841_004956 [Planctomycetota bacterium]|jgi:hypothetical protein
MTIEFAPESSHAIGGVRITPLEGETPEFEVKTKVGGVFGSTSLSGTSPMSTFSIRLPALPMVMTVGGGEVKTYKEVLPLGQGINSEDPSVLVLRRR